MKVEGQLTATVLQLGKRFWRSVWLFPVALVVPLLFLTTFQISGSSIGFYHGYFYGEAKDPDLLVNNPRPIRSDEWLVVAPLILGQENNDYERINQTIGNGQDQSLLADVAYKEWSAAFKPHNWAFFVMPLDNAFAFKWWLIGYLLIISCYFFILSLLPGRRLLAAVLSLAFFCSPFVQWWYNYGTLNSLSYILLAGVFFMKIINEKKRLQSFGWALLLGYILACFAMVLYPPFQIGCALVMATFGVGYVLEKRNMIPPKVLIKSLGVVAGAAIVAGLITFTYLQTRAEAVHTVQNTAYPGKRIQTSGGYDVYHLMSGHLGAQLQLDDRAKNYLVPEKGLVNQSENSNFVLLAPFLLIPSLYLIYKYYRDKKQILWALLLGNVLFVTLVAWLLVPGLNALGKLLQLGMVPHTRMLIALGLLNIVLLAVFIRNYEKYKTFLCSRWVSAGYALIVLAVELFLGLYAMDRTPGFVGIYRVIAFALPIPLIIYWLLRKRFLWASIVLLVFSAFMVSQIHPLYRGTEVIRETPLSQTIRSIAAKDDGRWATEHFLLENFASMNGARSIGGVYMYPQLDMWRGADPTASEDIYNRYAHTIFAFDRDAAIQKPTSINLVGGDMFGISTEPCGSFLKERDVRYLLVSQKLDSGDNCAQLHETVTYPTQSFYIYRLVF